MSDKKICSWCLGALHGDEHICPHCGYDGSQKNPVGALPLGVCVAGRYRIGRYLRIDGEGATYLAYDQKVERAVLVKEYLPATLCLPREKGLEVLPKPGSEVLFKTALYDFGDLYATMMRYQNAPVFVQVYDVAKDNGTLYAVKEYVRSKTLVEYLNTAGYMDFHQAFDMLLPVFQALETLHSNNLLHRGVSPENILVDKRGKVRLNGIATQALRTNGSELKSSLYKGYSAPEQYEITCYQGEFTDVYGLAAVLYTCITGLVPPKATERFQPDSLQPVNQPNKGKISHRQAQVLTKALSVKPEERQQTVAELEAQLRGEEREKRFAGRLSGLTSIQKQILLGVGAVALLAIIGWALLRLLQGGDELPADPSSSQTTSQTEDNSGEKVPNFVGQFYTDVQADPAYRSRYIFVTEEVFSSQYKAGQIAEQSPLADASYESGTTIYLKISKGEETADLPGVVGQTVENAKLALAEKGISYEIVPVYDPALPVGSVSGMDKPAGTPIRIAREKVILYVVEESPETSAPAEPQSPEEN